MCEQKVQKGEQTQRERLHQSRENTATNGSQVTKCGPQHTDLIPAQRISTKQSETSAEQRDYNCGPEGEQDRMNAWFK